MEARFPDGLHETQVRKKTQISQKKIPYENKVDRALQSHACGFEKSSMMSFFQMPWALIFKKMNI